MCGVSYVYKIPEHHKLYHDWVKQNKKYTNLISTVYKETVAQNANDIVTSDKIIEKTISLGRESLVFLNVYGYCQNKNVCGFAEDFALIAQAAAFDAITKKPPRLYRPGTVC